MSTPRLVLLPGFDGTGDLFDPFVAALAPSVPRTVIRYTTPALTTYAECVAAVREQLPRDEPYVLVGESFSGPIAVTIAAQQPSGLCGLVLVGSFVSSPSIILKWMAACIRFLPTHQQPGWISDLFLMRGFSSPALRQQVANAMAQVAPQVIRARLRAIAVCDVSAEVSKIVVPILYLRASDDRLVPRRCGDRIARLSLRVRILEINAPHLLLQCAPRESAVSISRFAEDALRLSESSVVRTVDNL